MPTSADPQDHSVAVGSVHQTWQAVDDRAGGLRVTERAVLRSAQIYAERLVGFTDGVATYRDFGRRLRQELPRCKHELSGAREVVHQRTGRELLPGGRLRARRDICG